MIPSNGQRVETLGSGKRALRKKQARMLGEQDGFHPFTRPTRSGAPIKITDDGRVFAHSRIGRGSRRTAQQRNSRVVSTRVDYNPLTPVRAEFERPYRLITSPEPERTPRNRADLHPRDPRRISVRSLT